MSENFTTVELERSNVHDLRSSQHDQDPNNIRGFRSAYTYCETGASTHFVFTFKSHGNDHTNGKYLVENCIEFGNKATMFPTKVLRATIEHAFSNLSANDRRTIATNIFSGTHGITPNTAYLTNNGSKYVSKDVLLAAMETAEKRNSGTSERILQSLINLSYAPRITNAIFEFLLFEFDGEVQLVSRYSALNSSNRVDHHTTIFPGASRKTSVFAKLCGTIQGHLTKTKTTGKNVLTLSIVLNVVLVSALCSVVIINYTGKTTDNRFGQPVLQHNLNDVPNQNISEDTSKKDDKNELVISIKSYDEYCNIFPLVSEGNTFHLDIYLDYAYNWPQSSIIFNRSLITTIQLGGRFSFDIIKNIIGQVDEMTTFILDNKDNELCLYNRKYDVITDEYATTTALEHLIMKGASECLHLYNFISTTIKLTHLRYLTFEDSMITKYNVEYVQNIIKASREGLEHLTFSNTTLYTSVIENRLGTLGAVQSLQIDINNDKDLALENIPKEIHFIFPHLQTFSSKNGFISVNQFRNILKCKQLSSISTAIEFSNDQNEINLYSLVGSLAKLSQINLSLKFFPTGNGDQCKILGLPQLRKNMKFQLWHNCSTDEDNYTYR